MNKTMFSFMFFAATAILAAPAQAYSPKSLPTDPQPEQVVMAEKNHLPEVGIVPASTSMQTQLEQLLNGLAPTTPTEAVTTWINGVKKRNAALQYAVMSPELQKQNLPVFSEANWTTGSSSPWHDHEKIIKSTKLSETAWEFLVQFELDSSTGLYAVATDRVTVQKRDDHWFITGIKGVSSDAKLSQHHVTLPSGEQLSDNEVPAVYQNVSLMLRTFGIASSGDPVANLVTYYQEGQPKVLSRQELSLPSGKAALIEVADAIKPDSSQTQYYLIIWRDYPNRDDMKLAYTIIASSENKQTDVKSVLLDIAKKWELPR